MLHGMPLGTWCGEGFGLGRHLCSSARIGVCRGHGCGSILPWLQLLSLHRQGLRNVCCCGVNMRRRLMLGRSSMRCQAGSSRLSSALCADLSIAKMMSLRVLGRAVSMRVIAPLSCTLA